LSTIIKVKRGSTLEVESYTPQMGEPVWNSQTNRLYVGDGVSLGGNPVFPFDIIHDHQNKILDKDLITAPGAPTIGDRYIVAGLGGTWSPAIINDVAEWKLNGWEFTTPRNGAELYVEDEDLVYRFIGSSWIKWGQDHTKINGQTYIHDNTFEGTVVSYELVYNNAGTYTKALADGTSKQKVIGIALEVGSSDTNTNSIVCSGFVENSGWTWTPGDLLYLSNTTDGLLTTTVSDIQVGLAVSTTVIIFQAVGTGGGTTGASLSYQDNVKDKDLLDPPTSPTIGDRYIINGIGVNGWAGKDYNVAEWQGAAWTYTAPFEGLTTYVEDEDIPYIYNNAGVWVKYGSVLTNVRFTSSAATFEGTVVDGDLVYRNTDGSYYKAVADGTVAAKVSGYADVARKLVIHSGIITETGLGFTAGDDLYLSDTVTGLITNTVTTVKVGIHLSGDDFLFQIGTGGGAGVDYSLLEEHNLYYHLLQHSIYQNCFYDTFEDSTKPYVDSTSTTMVWSQTDNNWSANSLVALDETLQSVDIFDTASGLVSVNSAMAHVEYTNDSTSDIIIEMTSDGINWETTTNDTIHTFTNTGVNLGIRITADTTSTVTVESYGILYNPNTVEPGSTSSRRKIVAFPYEGLAIDEEVIIDGFYFDVGFTVDKISIFARTAPTGADLTVDVLKNGVEVGSIATLTNGSSYEKTILSIASSLLITDRFGLKIKTIGSTNAGHGLIISVHGYES